MKKKHSIQINGILSKHKRGFGFVKPDNSNITDGKDVFIPPNALRDAMNGDNVTVAIDLWRGHGEKLEGRVVKILERSSREFVGTFHKLGSWGYVSPENRKEGEEVHIGKKDVNGAEQGDKVIVRITKYPSDRKAPQGRILEILSRKGEMGGDVKALIKAFHIEEAFPPHALEEADAISQVIEAKELLGRRDLRNLTVFTIDGADAKDFDDAVSIERLPDGILRLGVHIADVCHYVREGKAVDREAFRRGTSIYLADRVIPMLPFALSDGICSLRPREDRMTLTAMMDVDQKGTVLRHEIFESVIRSCERLVYTDISDLLEYDNPEMKLRYQHILPELLMMHELAETLQKKRKTRGSLDFDFDEAHLTLNEEGIPVAVEIAERRIANKIIEEFMLLANETVAEHFHAMNLPFVYRIHEQPALEKMEAFQRFLQTLGLRLHGKPESIKPKALNEILEQVAGTQAENVVNTVMLRSMKKASYNTTCFGHFGLGVLYYCHFTSPIRRYPDLMIHRVIKEALHREIDEERLRVLHYKTESTAATSSAAERNAEELEREVEKLKKAQYMEKHLFEEFSGIISGVSNGGFFVQLTNTIEGMVSIDSLGDDHYSFEPDKYRLIGKRHRKVYALGKEVRVRVFSVDLENREIRFELV